MKRTLTTTIAVLAALAWLPPSTGAAAAQDSAIEEAIEKLQRGEHTPVKKILRQVDGPRTAAELDALADQLAAMVLDHGLPGDVRRRARFALSSAADPESGYGGTTYPRAFDLLVKVYEGGYHHALRSIWRIPERGPAYRPMCGSSSSGASGRRCAGGSG